MKNIKKMPRKIIKRKKKRLYIVSFADDRSQYIVNIKGLNKRDVFNALYHHASPYLGSESDWSDVPLTDGDYNELEHIGWNVCFYRGRCMNVNLSGDSFDSFMYDRNAMYKKDSGRVIINTLRTSKINDFTFY